METRFLVHFFALSKTIYEWVEWMCIMSEWSAVDVENEFLQTLCPVGL